MTVTGNQIVKATANMLVGGSDLMQNVYYFRMDVAGWEDDGVVTQAIADHLDDAYQELTSKFGADVTFTTIDFYNVTADAPMLPEAWPTMTVGTSALQTLPLQVAAVVSFPTLVKRSVGKKYISGLSEGANDGGGVLDAGHTASLEAFAALLIGSVLADDSLLYPGHIRALTGAFVEWDQYRVGPILGTQRRRKMGVGA